MRHIKQTIDKNRLLLGIFVIAPGQVYPLVGAQSRTAGRVVVVKGEIGLATVERQTQAIVGCPGVGAQHGVQTADRIRFDPGEDGEAAILDAQFLSIV